MKLLITSPDALLDLNGELFPGIEQALYDYKNLSSGNDVVVISSHLEKLQKIPKSLNPIHLRADVRAKKILIESIQESTDFKKINQIIVLGANEQDFRLAINSNLLLFAAKYAETPLNCGSKVFTYGVHICSVQELERMLQRLLSVQSPWFFRLEVDEKTTIFSLTNANTFYQSEETIDINNKFRSCIKDGKDTHREAFLTYFLFSCYDEVNVDDFEKVKYWSIYPSSKSSDDPDLEFFKEIVRKAFRQRLYPNLFIRHKETRKKSDIRDNNIRIFQSCQDELESIHINPIYQKNNALKGATVCIIDDYTTYGTSCEAARILLEKAEVSKIIFVTLGKFGQEYYKQNYNIEGDIYKPNFKVTKNSQPIALKARAQLNYNANKVLQDSLQGLI